MELHILVISYHFLNGLIPRIIKSDAVLLFKNMDKLLEGMIEEHRNGESRNSVVNHLLSLQKSRPSYYSNIISKVLWWHIYSYIPIQKLANR